MLLSFRQAIDADVPEVVTLVQSAYRGEASKDGWTTEADLLDGQRTDAAEVGAVVDAAHSRLLLAVDEEDTLIACCQLEQRSHQVGYFGMFSVRPDRQGLGIGDALLTEAERIAVAEWDATTMHLTVIVQREELIAWYERRGYARTGQLSPFPYDDPRFGVPRRPDLAFLLLIKALSAPQNNGG